MSIAQDEIKDFLESNFKKGLEGYFACGNEEAERVIVENASSFKVDEDSIGYGKRYSVEIEVPLVLSGRVLRNRSRIESNLLTAIRQLVSLNKPHWNNSVIRKVTITIK